MASLNEAKILFGMQDLIDEETGESVSQSDGFKFFEISVDQVAGTPTEFASNQVTADCFTFQDETTLYIATQGSCDIGTEIV